MTLPALPPSAAQEDRESARKGRWSRDLPRRAAPNDPASQQPQAEVLAGPLGEESSGS